jgi:hypothetical protein
MLSKFARVGKIADVAPFTLKKITTRASRISNE